MPTTLTTTIRLAPAAKRRIAAAARRHRVSTHKFIIDAALDRANAVADDAKLVRLAALVEQVREAVEDELDVRLAESRWGQHLKHKTRLYTPEEVKRELGLPA